MATTGQGRAAGEVAGSGAGAVRALPTLGPLDVLGGALARRRAFPFDEPALEPTFLGRNAVWRAVKRLGLEGREIVVPAYHHGVEVDALVAAGAKPVFARVDEHLRLDLADVERKIGPETGAIYVIHYAGFPQPQAELLWLARRRSLLLIEDCALATFSSDGEIPLGSVGDASIFCFYKTLPVPHGGALLVRRRTGLREVEPLEPPPLLPAVSHTAGSVLLSAERALGAPGALLRRFARDLTSGTREKAWKQDTPVGTQRFDREVVALAMSPVAEWVARSVDAAAIVRKRRANWLALHEALGELGRSVWTVLPEGVCPLFYALRVENKDRALGHLRARGVEAIDFWRFHHPAVDAARFPEVSALRQQVLELPCHQDLRPGEVRRIAEAAREAVVAARGGVSRTARWAGR